MNKQIKNNEIILIDEEDEEIIDPKFGFTLSQSSKSSTSQLSQAIESNSLEKYVENNQMNSIDINYTPHFRTITDSGKSHFTRVADGLAEFIDNSIEACRNCNDGSNINWTVEISFFFNKDTKNGYVIIGDNGVGMCTEKLTQFAVYSLDQATRKEIWKDKKNANKGGFISKYGVGAKEAGFFLGDRIRVVTKQEDSNQVLEMTLDSKEFEERYKAKMDVFSGQIKIRELYSNANVPIDELSNKGIIDFMKKHERENKNFTYIVVRLYQETVSNLLQHRRYDDLQAELGEIYHFHLHPEHCPGNLNAIYYTDNKYKHIRNGGTLPDAFKTHLKTPRFSETNTHRKNDVILDIKISVWVNNRNEIDCKSLRLCKDYLTHKFIDEAEACYRFNIEVPNPVNNSNNNEVLPFTQEERNLYGDELISGRSSDNTIQGIIFYYPFKNGKEKRPIPTCGSRTGTQLLDSGTDEIEMFYNTYKPVNILDILWVDRLVPESSISQLTFFPAPNEKKLINDNIAPLWKNRVKGYLFFDRNFPITNNKLRIQVDPDISTWLNDKKRSREISYSPKNNETNFKEWLQLCHKYFDCEYSYEIRDIALEKTLDNRNVSYFKKLIVGNEKFNINVGEKIKFKPLQTGAGRNFIFAKITSFELNMFIEEGVNRSRGIGGVGSFRYIREPVSIYGGEIENSVIPLSAIDFTDSSTFSATIKEIDNVEKEGPKSLSVVVFYYDENGKIFQKIIKEKDCIELEAGERIYKIGVQILNAAKDSIIARPFSNPRHKYRVNLIIIENNISWGTTSQLYEFDELKNEDIDFHKENAKNKKKPFDNSFFSFYQEKNSTFTSSHNNNNFKVEVLDENRVVLSRKIIIKIKPSTKEPFDFKIDIAESSSKSIKLGGFLPQFFLSVIDKNGNTITDFGGQAKLIISNELVNVFFKYENSCNINNDETLDIEQSEIPIWQFEAEDNGSITFYDDQFRVTQKKSNQKLFDSTIVKPPLDIKLEFKCQLVIDQQPMTNDTDSSICRDFGTVKKIKYKLSPGLPCHIEKINPDSDSYPISILNGDSLNNVTFAIYDEFGNRTAPSEGNCWNLQLANNNIISNYNHRAPILNSGVGTFPLLSFVTRTDRIPSTGLLLTQRVTLVNEVISNKKSNDIIINELCSTELEFNIMPTILPTDIVVLYKGEKIVSPWSLKVGTIISDLSFRVLDNNNEEIDFDCTWFESKSNSIDVSWNHNSKKTSKGSKKKKIINNSLPDIILQKQAEVIPIDYDVTISIDGNSLETTFSILPIANEPASWKLLTHNNFISNGCGLMSGESIDLIQKITGIVMVDDSDNTIDLEEDDELIPKLYIKWSEEYDNDEDDDNDDYEEEDDNNTNSNKRKVISNIQSQQNKKIKVNSSFSNKITELKLQYKRNLFSESSKVIGGYVIYPGERIDYFPTPGVVYLHIEDENNKLKKSKVLKCPIFSGYPHQVILLSESYKMDSTINANNNAIDKYNKNILNITRFKDLSDLNVKFVDNNGNMASVGDIKGLRYQISSIAINESETGMDINDIENNFHDFETKTYIVTKNKKITVSQTNVESFNFSSIYIDNEKYFTKKNIEISTISSLGNDIYKQIILKCESSYKIGLDEFKLPSEYIKCNYLWVNAVISMDIYMKCHVENEDENTSNSQIDNDELLKITDNVINFSCDNAIPGLIIELITDNGSVYNMKNIQSSISNSSSSQNENINDINITILKKVIEMNEKGTSYNTKYETGYVSSKLVLYNNNQLQLVLSNTNDQLNHIDVGVYSIKIVYSEKRNELLSILPSYYHKVEKLITMNVIAGECTEIKPDSHSLLKLDKDIVVSNVNCDNSGVSNSSKTTRIIGSNIIINAIDKFNNITVFPSNAVVRCHLKKYNSLSKLKSSPLIDESKDTTNNEVDSDELPRLLGSDNDTHSLIGKMSSDKKKCVFNNLELIPDTGHGDNLIELCFYLEDNNDVVYSTIFHFITNAVLVEKAQNIMLKLNPIELKLKQYHNDLSLVENQLIDFNQRIKSSLKRSHHGQLKCLADDDVDQISSSDISKLIKIFKEQQTDMSNNSQIRYPKAQNRPPASITNNKEGMIGLVVDLAYIDDYNKAFIISWAAGKSIDAYVVANSEIAQDLYNKNIKSWSLDLIQNFTIPMPNGVRRCRTAEEKLECKLQLPSLKLAGGRTIKGNPEYMVDIIKLDECNETLRESVFYSALKNSILIDTMENAIDYKKELIRANKTIPTMYTLNGERLGADGILNPGTGGKAPKELNYIFGQQQLTNSIDFKSICYDLEVAHEVIELLKQREQTLNKQKELLKESNNYILLKNNIDAYQKELDSLGIPLTQTSLVYNSNSNNNKTDVQFGKIKKKSNDITMDDHDTNVNIQISKKKRI